MSELKDRIKNDTDMSNTDVNAVNSVYRGDLETAVFNARIRIEAIDGDTHTEEEYNDAQMTAYHELFVTWLNRNI
jgi:TRAP-type uncharacterized transport system substrate-binding protein